MEMDGSLMGWMLASHRDRQVYSCISLCWSLPQEAGVSLNTEGFEGRSCVRSLSVNSAWPSHASLMHSEKDKPCTHSLLQPKIQKMTRKHK